MSTRISRAEDRRKIADIDAQISELKAQIQALQAEKEVVWDRIPSYQYPVSTLPNEIMSETFVHFLPPYPLCPPLPGPCSPTTLTQACRKWREIALATPYLWRAIQLDESRLESDAAVTIVASWLGRSGPLPLSIQADDFTVIEEAILDIVLPYRARWEYVFLHLINSDLPCIPGPMPLLQQFEIRFRNCAPRQNVSFRELEVPRLRSATLWDLDYPTTLLPWSQLTALTLVRQTLSACTPILQRAVNFEHCELILCGEANGEPDITLPSLKSLVLGRYCDNTGGISGAGYLRSFIAPALRSLRVHRLSLNLSAAQAIHPFLPIGPVQSIKSFIDKSRCKLDHICITGALDSRSPKRAFLEVFPEIDISFAPDA